MYKFTGKYADLTVENPKHVNYMITPPPIQMSPLYKTND